MKILVCASARNLSPAFFAATTEIGHHIGEKKYTLIYGGGDIGLMAEAARASAEAGGLVKGYIPQVFNKITPQQPHTNIKTDVVETIFERKERMLFDSDILLVLPGGIGTYDEIFEGATANDIQCFADDTQKLKPIVIANFPDESGVPYFRGLKLSLEDAVRNKAIDPSRLNMFHFAENVEGLKAWLDYYADKGIPPAASAKFPAQLHDWDDGPSFS